MTLKEYASMIYEQMKYADSTEQVEKIFNDAIQHLKNQKLSNSQIEEFKGYLRKQVFLIKEAQENKQTLKNQQKAMELLKKD